MRLTYRHLSLFAGLLFAVPALLQAAPETPLAKETAPLIGGLDDLKKLDRQLVSNADRMAAATVSLISTSGGASGSGVIVNREGLILSAGHVLAALTGDVIVLFADGKRFKAETLGADFDRDAAMLRITDPGEYPFVETAPVDPLPINSWCVALGHPGGFDPLRTPPLRLGRVTDFGTFLITDCTVVSGDSGGPLFDIEGRVIGIHSNIGATLGENRHVPIKVYRDQWDKLLAGKRSGERFNRKPAEKKPSEDAAKNKAAKGKSPAQPKLGIKLGKESSEGVRIEAVENESPAAKAGLKAGDVIVKLAGKKTTTAEELTEALASRPARPFVALAYQRDKKLNRVKIPFPQPAKMAAAAKPEPAGDDLASLLERALAEAKDGKPELRLTPEMVEKFGGMDRIQEQLKAQLAKKMPGMEQLQSKPPSNSQPPKSDKEMDELVEKLRQRAQANSGRLQVTPEDLNALGGIEELRRRMRSMPTVSDDFFTSVLNALKPVTKVGSVSTATVFADDKEVALGTVVTVNGGILTKDSETGKGTITVRVGGEKFQATLVKRFPEWDLALFHIPAVNLKPIKFAKDSPPATRGSLLTVPGPTLEPLGIGMVSVTTRPLGRIGFIGIESDRVASTEGRIFVRNAIQGGPADKAGIKTGDVITSINGKAVIDPIQFSRTITSFKPGDTVKFDVLRGEETLKLEVKLDERPMPKIGEDFLKVNRMSGPLSPKIDGFPRALQHDIPLDPAQCGGPLLDLEGRCLGINVARAGRVNTMAIPTNSIAELLDGSRADLSALAAKAESEVTAEDIAEVAKQLESIQKHLKQLEKRLEKKGQPQGAH